MLKLGNDWDELLKSEYEKEYFLNMREFLKKEYLEKRVFPIQKEIFTAFKLTPFKDVKVVILGQDPYHGENQAHGLAFSVKKDVPLPPSLKNIFKEIRYEGVGDTFNSGYLVNWATQGIFLLNATLTVREGEPNSHSKIGWQIFTDRVIELLNDKDKPIIFVLWGNNAREKKSLITNKNHIILESVHPSPLSASRGFFGCNHFKKIDEILKERYNFTIDFNIY